MPEEAFGHKRVSFGIRPAVMDHKSTPLASPLENPLSDPNPTPSNGKAQPPCFEISNLPSEIKRSVVGLFRRKTYDLTERKVRSQSGKPTRNPTTSIRAKVRCQLKWQQVMDHKSTPLASPLENPVSDPNPTPSNGKAQPPYLF
jgi:hypothetical protein